MFPLFGYEDGDDSAFYDVVKGIALALVGAISGGFSVWMSARLKNREIDLTHKEADKQARQETAKQDVIKENKVIAKYEKYMQHQEDRIKALEGRLDTIQAIANDTYAKHLKCEAESTARDLRLDYYEHIMRENGIKFTPFDELLQSDDWLPKSPKDQSPG